MGERRDDGRGRSLIKIVYFDEQSASDYLDMSAGGKVASTSEDVRNRTTDLHAQVETKLAAKLSWLPFLGASAETAAGISASSAGQSILSKTLSNTILTDYLGRVRGDGRVRQLEGLRLTAAQGSMAFMKMYTPYMVIAKTEDLGVDLARLDEALERAKGYYELLGEDAGGGKRVLRFNIKAFRNNYGLTDLLRMRLVFHGVLVGQTGESDLGFEAEMAAEERPAPLSALELLDGPAAAGPGGELLDVFDVILAGVEHDA
jgi:hypothetical protein